MADNKLYITISDERGGGENGTPTKKPEDGSKSKKEADTLGRYLEHELFHLAKSSVTQAVNYQIANIGNFTGNYVAQQKVNEAKQFASGLMSIGMTTLAGAKYGPYGAIAGFVIGAVSQLASGFYSEYSNRIENAKANYDIEQLRMRAGLNTVYDGSRGTEN